MKQLRLRPEIYKASNVMLDTKNLIATSYDWWKFLKPMGQLMVFNDYRYSVTTARHQWKVKRLLEQYGIQVHAFIETRQSLSNPNWAIDSIALYKARIEKLREEMLKGKAAKNLERAASIKELEAKIKQVKALARMDKVASHA